MARLLVDVVGVGAGLCSMGSFIPQIAKIVREKRVQGVSLRMYVVTVTGFVLWIVYGALLGSWPVWLSNAASLVLAATILGLNLRYGSGAPGPRG